MVSFITKNKIKLNLDNEKETSLILDFLVKNKNTFMSSFTKQRNRTNSKERI